MSGAGDGSLLTMTGPFGDDARPIALRAAEAISEPFAFTVDITSPQQSIDPDAVLTKAVCVSLDTGTGDPRLFHGVARSLRAGGINKRGTWSYTVELVPAFWFAAQTMDCRVFLKQSVADILATLFGENNVAKYRFSIQGAKPKRDHTVQFNETDFAFACRLMEEEGYFYFFEHASDGHTMVVADSNQAFSAALSDTLHVVPTGGNFDVLTEWRRRVETAHGKWRLLDYDLVNPGAPVDGSQTTLLKTGGASSRDMTAWPALEYASGDASRRARLRQEAAEAGAAIYEGVGTCHSLAPGTKFKIGEDPLTGESNASFVALSVNHSAVDESEVAGGAGWRYANTLAAFPSATTWREPRTIPRPAMSGIHLAIVLAPDGEDISVDQYGRIKVRMMWDHRGDATSDTTIWVRVMSPWASNTWGWQSIPRVGNEVAVAFVDGDPDRPIVVGSVHNASMMPIFALPDEKTKSGLRTRSSLKGGTADFSEFSFDDRKGDELVFLHAQKDHAGEVENDETWHVMHDQKITVDHDRTRLTKGAESIEVDKSMTIKVGQGRSTEITQSDESLTVKQGDISVEATAGAIAHQANKSYKVTSQTDAIALSAMTDVTVDSSTGSVKITAAQSITLSVTGGGSIKIDATGVAVQGMMVKAAADMMLDLKGGMMAQLKGGAMTTLKGGIIMIN